MILLLATLVLLEPKEMDCLKFCSKLGYESGTYVNESCRCYDDFPYEIILKP